MWGGIVWEWGTGWAVHITSCGNRLVTVVLTATCLAVRTVNAQLIHFVVCLTMPSVTQVHQLMNGEMERTEKEGNGKRRNLMQCCSVCLRKCGEMQNMVMVSGPRFETGTCRTRVGLLSAHPVGTCRSRAACLIDVRLKTAERSPRC